MDDLPSTNVNGHRTDESREVRNRSAAADWLSACGLRWTIISMGALKDHQGLGQRPFVQMFLLASPFSALPRIWNWAVKSYWSQDKETEKETRDLRP